MFPMEITGADGRSLRTEWAGGAHAHLGMTCPAPLDVRALRTEHQHLRRLDHLLPGAPGRYLRQALQRVAATGAAAIDVRDEVERHSDMAVQARFAGTAWTQCDSWYRTGAGRIVANCPAT